LDLIDANIAQRIPHLKSGHSCTKTGSFDEKTGRIKTKKRPLLKTVLEVIAATTDYFAKSGVESPLFHIDS